MNNSNESAQILHSIIRTLSGSSFAATVGDFYRGEIAVLNVIHLYENESKEVFPSMISSFLHISRPTVTSALRTLEKKELIKRTLYEEDRRKIFIALTESGRELVKTKNEEVDDWCSSMATKFGANHFNSLLLQMKEIVECIE